MKTPIRLQIMVYNKLVAEVIGTSDYCSNIWAKWCALRYERNKELGCCATYRTDIKRVWNIPVGSVLSGE